MRTWTGPIDIFFDPIPTILVAWQVLATHRGTETVFHGWARRTNRVDSTLEPPSARRSPILTPWARSDLWTSGVWCLATMILRRFLRQSVPGDEARFLTTLNELRDITHIDSWNIGFIVAAYYFVAD